MTTIFRGRDWYIKNSDHPKYPLLIMKRNYCIENSRLRELGFKILGQVETVGLRRFGDELLEAKQVYLEKSK